MGNTRNGHAWSLYTSNKTHELASRIPELALMSQGAEELFVTLAYCRYILQPIVRVAYVYWFFCRIECELIKPSCDKTWY